MAGGETAREALGPHLPHLRRYARALAGSQKSGDAYVRVVLESLIEAPDSIAFAGNPRLDLFRLFHAFWRPAPDSGDARHAGHQALLLTAVEGFTPEEAADILGSDPASVAAAIETTLADIAAATRSRVLVIEDEPLIAMHLEQIVEDMGHIVAGSAMTRDEAVAEAERVRPDLVLADIQLADGSSGLEAVKDILDRFDVPVIFITAYPERLLTGERPEPTFLVTKPFGNETVMATIGQALLARHPELAPAA